MKNPLSLWSTVAIVVSITLLGGAIRYVIAFEELLWLDELHTSWTLRSSFRDVLGRSAAGNQAPLFFWLTWIPVWCLGESELTLRSISLLAGVAVMPISGWLVWKWTSSAIAATVTVLLVAMDMQFVFYATEARPYALVQLLGVIQFAMFRKFLACKNSNDPMESKRNGNRFRPDLRLAVVSAAMIYVHVTSIWMLVAELSMIMMLAGLRWYRGSNDGEGRYWKPAGQLFTTGIVFALLCVPVFIQAGQVFERRGNWDLVSSPLNVFRDQSQMFVQSIATPLICLAAFAGVGVLFRQRRQTRAPQPVDPRPSSGSLDLMLVMLWAITPTACVIVLAAIGVAPLALVRYTLVGSAAFPIFAGMVTAQAGPTTKQLAIGMLVLGFAVYQNPIANDIVFQQRLPLLRTENWQSAVNAINAETPKSSHPVFLFSNLIEDVDAVKNQDPRFQEYLLFPISGIYSVDANGRKRIPRPTIPLEHWTDNDISEIGQQGGGWVLFRGHPELRDEVANQLLQRLGTSLNRKPDSIPIRLLESPANHVYLFSIDL